MERSNPKWFDELPIAVTVIDQHGIIETMNAAAQQVFAKDGGAALIGRSLFDCHSPSSKARIQAMMASGESNHYTITKKGERKIIHQLPRLIDGKVVGLVEISIPIPEEMAHFNRDAKPQ